MKNCKLIYSILFLFLFFSVTSFAQLEGYQYKRDLSDRIDQWHKIELPNTIYVRTKPDLSDIRIVTKNEQDELIEAPYLINSYESNFVKKVRNYTAINKSKNKNGYFVTFKVEQLEPINKIELSFEKENFDYRINLESSNDKLNWFTILENERVLSINYEQTNYRFTDLNFPSSNYQYYRVLVQTQTDPKLTNATLSVTQPKPSKVREYSIKEVSIVQNKDKRQTEIKVELEDYVPVNQFTITISDNVEYIRPLTIKYLVDTTTIRNKTIENYQTIKRENLSSFQKNTFKVPTIKTKQLLFVVDNYDNQPLTIQDVAVSGQIYELVARFTETTPYSLVYGNKDAQKPNYDIVNFRDKLPTNLKELTVGEEQQIFSNEPKEQRIFNQPIWLWSILIIMTIVLSWFAFKMLKS